MNFLQGVEQVSLSGATTTEPPPDECRRRMRHHMNARAGRTGVIRCGVIAGQARVVVQPTLVNSFDIKPYSLPRPQPAHAIHRRPASGGGSDYHVPAAFTRPLAPIEPVSGHRCHIDFARPNA